MIKIQQLTLPKKITLTNFCEWLCEANKMGSAGKKIVKIETVNNGLGSRVINIHYTQDTKLNNEVPNSAESYLVSEMQKIFDSL